MRNIEIDKNAQARKWVNGYTAVGIGIVIAAVIPGSTSVALIAMEVTMCYQIGKIYRGDGYTMADAAHAAKVIGLVAIAAQILALEALDFVPFAGWAVKGGIAGGVIKAMGESVIAYYEKQDRLQTKRLLPEAATVIDVPVVTAIRRRPRVDASQPVPKRLKKIDKLLADKHITKAEHKAKRKQILDDI